MSFVHLHLHSDASLLDGMIQTSKLVDRISEIGQTAVAVTDHGLLSSAVQLVKQAKDAGIKPIVGVEMYMATGPDMTEPAQNAGDQYHLTMLAQTAEGYQNLCRLSTLSYEKGFSYKPRLDKRTLAQHVDGILILSGCVGAELPQLLARHQDKKARKLVEWYQRVFGDRFIIEIQHHGGTGRIDHVRVEEAGKLLMTETDLNVALVDIANRYGIAIVATNDAHYLMPDEGQAHDALLCLSMGAWKGKNSMRFPGADDGSFEFYVKNELEMRKLSKKEWWDEACRNSAVIADTIDDDVVPMGQSIMPVYEIPKDLGYRVWKETGVLI